MENTVNFITLNLTVTKTIAIITIIASLMAKMKVLLIKFILILTLIINSKIIIIAIKYSFISILL